MPVLQRAILWTEIDRDEESRSVGDGQREVLGEDPDHGVRSRVDAELASDDVGISSELLEPESVREDDLLVIAALHLFLEKDATHHGPDAKEGKEGRRDPK